MHPSRGCASGKATLLHDDPSTLSGPGRSAIDGHGPADVLRDGTVPEPGPLPGEAAPPPFADGTFSKLHPSHVTVERIGNLIFAGVVGAGSLIPFGVFLVRDGPREMLPWLILCGGLLLAGVLAVMGWILPRKAYDATSYAISPYGAEIRRGIWWRHVIDVPRSRIQHTDVQQGPIARHFGLGKLIVYTAGTQHASVELDGLGHERALELRDFLLRGGDVDDAV